MLTQLLSSARLVPPILPAQSALQISGSTQHQKLASILPVDKLDALTAHYQDPITVTHANLVIF